MARRAFITPQTMATILANLEGKDLITRSPSRDHGRVLVAKLTPSGRALLKKADKNAVGFERHLGDAFTDEERQNLDTLLERAIAAITSYDA